MVNGGILNRGGTEAFIMNVIRGLQSEEMSFEVMVHGYDKGVYDDELQALGVPIHQVPVKGKDPLGNKRAIKKVLSEGSFDVIHSHLNDQTGPILAMAKKAGIPIRLSHSHSTESYSSNQLKQILGQMARKKIKPNATSFLSCGQLAGEFLYGDDFTIIPNAIDTDMFKFDSEQRDMIRRQYNILDTDVVYGHVGGFNHIKNHQFLIQVFAKVHQSNPKAKLLLVGSGNLIIEMKQLVNKLQIQDAVIFAGLQENVVPYLSAMDVFVMPSLFEGFPYVLVEAQTNGLPIVCTSNIDPGVALTSLIQFASLEDEATWIRLLSHIQPQDRHSFENEIVAQGFDLQSLNDLMMKYYTGEVQ